MTTAEARRTYEQAKSAWEGYRAVAKDTRWDIEQAVDSEVVRSWNTAQDAWIAARWAWYQAEYDAGKATS